jgi:hypothetical protein
METQTTPSGNTAPADEPSRDAGVYLLLIKQAGDNSWKVLQIPTKKDVAAALDKIGPERLAEIKLYKGAKEVEIRTKVQFTF